MSDKPYGFNNFDQVEHREEMEKKEEPAFALSPAEAREINCYLRSLTTDEERITFMNIIEAGICENCCGLNCGSECNLHK